MALTDAAITRLDRLIAAIERGAPEREIARLRADYERAEQAALARLESWERLMSSTFGQEVDA